MCVCIHALRLIIPKNIKREREMTDTGDEDISIVKDLTVALSISCFVQANSAFYQLMLELINAYEPASIDLDHPNTRRLGWYAGFFSSMLAAGLVLFILTPTGRRYLHPRSSSTTTTTNIIHNNKDGFYFKNKKEQKTNPDDSSDSD